MVFFVTKEGEERPCGVCTSKRGAVDVAIEAMLNDKSLEIEDMAEAKQQLKTGKSVGFKTNYTITEIQTNKLL